MASIVVKRNKVEELSQYGKPLTSMPEDAVKAQERIAMAEIKSTYGRFGRVPFFIRMFFEQRRLKKRCSAPQILDTWLSEVS